MLDVPAGGTEAWVSPWPRQVRLLERSEPVVTLGMLPDHPLRGRRFWLFRQGDGVDPTTGGLSWFLHGFF